MRIATVHLGYDQLETGYKELVDIATSHEDEFSSLAATRYLSHAYAYGGDGAFDKALEVFSVENAPQLWQNPEFRQKLLDITMHSLESSDGNREQGYSLLVALIGTSEDEVAVAAATNYIEYAAAHEDRKAFRLIRKALQANKYLWAQVKFRALIFKLKEEIEDKR